MTRKLIDQLEGGAPAIQLAGVIARDGSARETEAKLRTIAGGRVRKCTEEAQHQNFVGLLIERPRSVSLGALGLFESPREWHQVRVGRLFEDPVAGQRSKQLQGCSCPITVFAFHAR